MATASQTTYRWLYLLVLLLGGALSALSSWYLREPPVVVPIVVPGERAEPVKPVDVKPVVPEPKPKWRPKWWPKGDDHGS